MSDEGFREIQLNGKQLIFLFMAATVVLVVSFLFGVLVGRDVRGGTPAPEAISAEIAPDPEPMTAADTAVPPAAGGSPEARPEPQAEPLSYADRLLRDTPPEENLKPERPSAADSTASLPSVQEPVASRPPAAERPVAAAPPPARSAAAETPRPAPATPPAAAAAAPRPSDPSGPGFAVQVSISDNRQDADRMAAQLIAKGYPAFVVNPVKGTPKQIYRIRVGKYRTRKDAEEVLTRLERNEHFKPWIAR